MSVSGAHAFRNDRFVPALLPRRHQGVSRYAPLRSKSLLNFGQLLSCAEASRIQSSHSSRRKTMETAQSVVFAQNPSLSLSRSSSQAASEFWSGSSKWKRGRPNGKAHSPVLIPVPVTTPVMFDVVSLEADDNENNERCSTTMSTFSRECCDVLGQHTCHKCTKSKKQCSEKEKCESSFRSLRISERNFSVATLVKSRLPELSFSEIQDKLACGEISKRQLRSLNQMNNEEQNIDDPEYAPKKRGGNKLTKSAPSIKSHHRTITKEEVLLAMRKKQQRRGIMDILYPTFVSPRKAQQENETHFKVYYEPPLLPKSKQISEPSFFAGSESYYKLPDRLPEKILPPSDKRDHQNKRISEMENKLATLEPLEYEKTFVDSVDNLIKIHLGL